jgi:hypothetical protein
MAGALDLDMNPRSEQLVARLVELGRLREPKTEDARDLLLDIVLCAQEHLVRGPDPMDRAEAAHYVLACAVRPVEDIAWWDACAADFQTDRLVDYLTPLISDEIAPRLAEAGHLRLVGG